MRVGDSAGLLSPFAVGHYEGEGCAFKIAESKSVTGWKSTANLETGMCGKQLAGLGCLHLAAHF